MCILGEIQRPYMWRLCKFYYNQLTLVGLPINSNCSDYSIEHTKLFIQQQRTLSGIYYRLLTLKPPCYLI